MTKSFGRVRFLVMWTSSFISDILDTSFQLSGAESFYFYSFPLYLAPRQVIKSKVLQYLVYSCPYRELIFAISKIKVALHDSCLSRPLRIPAIREYKKNHPSCKGFRRCNAFLSCIQASLNSDYSWLPVWPVVATGIGYNWEHPSDISQFYHSTTPDQD